MPKYLKMFNEFQNFIEAVRADIEDIYEKRIINLILTYFDDVADLGEKKGKRGTYICELIKKHGSTTSNDIKATATTVRSPQNLLKSITSLEVENFRGFSFPEDFQFERQFTFVYGPNGSGKSSFCEAIEYSLLGYINEAIAKRIDLEDYIKNSVSGLGSNPILKGLDSKGEPTNILADPNTYRFCFIEKSRIDGFARIAANTPNEKQSLLSTLFGLDEFNDFVGNFNESIEKYLNLESAKEVEWKNQTQGIERRKTDISSSNDKLNKLNTEKESLVQELKLTSTFEELEVLLEGTEKDKSRIEELQNFVNSHAENEIVLDSTETLTKLFDGAFKEMDLFVKLDKTYSTRKSEVKFRDLFEAAKELETVSPNECPLCETPIKSTVKNPYENARLKLNELVSIAKLEGERESAFNNFNTSFKALNKSLIAKSKIVEQLFDELKILTLNEEELFTIDSQSLAIQRFNEINNHFESNLIPHKKIDEKITSHNQKINVHAEEIEKAKSELQILIPARTKIQNIKAKIKAENENIEEWKKEIRDDETKAQSLFLEAKSEKLIIEENAKYKKAYSTFLERLKKYKDELPSLHIGKLNSLTLEMYNQINSHDHRYEKIANIELPKTKSDTIVLSFEDKPELKHDALQILSEGHLRCLGLSILLAKNLNDNCPIIIFDDVVNAIDDDHRSGIRKLIFDHPRISEKQIIITSHSEPFVKDLENSVKGKYEDLVKKYDFSSDAVERRIRVRRNETQNHLKIIGESIDKNHWDNALYHCRCTLELIGNRLWRKLGEVYKVEFNVVIRKPKSEPDLMSVILALNNLLGKISTKYSDAKPHLEFLLGFRQKNPVEWNYLNTGTHESEDKPTLDNSIVKEIYQHLSDLDAITKK